MTYLPNTYKDILTIPVLSEQTLKKTRNVSKAATYTIYVDPDW